jgi:hypothetical protein
VVGDMIMLLLDMLDAESEPIPYEITDAGLAALEREREQEEAETA